jgi:hypothetical protein
VTLKLIDLLFITYWLRLHSSPALLCIALHCTKKVDKKGKASWPIKKQIKIRLQIFLFKGRGKSSHYLRKFLQVHSCFVVLCVTTLRFADEDTASFYITFLLSYCLWLQTSLVHLYDYSVYFHLLILLLSE